MKAKISSGNGTIDQRAIKSNSIWCSFQTVQEITNQMSSAGRRGKEQKSVFTPWLDSAESHWNIYLRMWAGDYKQTAY